VIHRRASTYTFSSDLPSTPGEELLRDKFESIITTMVGVVMRKTLVAVAISTCFLPRGNCASGGAS
jgi:hypothetical protein